MPCPLRVVVVAASALLLAFVALAPGADAGGLRAERCDGERSSEVRTLAVPSAARADAACCARTDDLGAELVGGAAETRERAAARRVGAGERPGHLARVAAVSRRDAAQERRARRADC